MKLKNWQPKNNKVLEKLAQEGYVVIAIWSFGRYPGDMTNEMEDMLEQVYDAEFALKYLGANKRFNIDLNKIGLLACSWGEWPLEYWPIEIKM